MLNGEVHGGGAVLLTTGIRVRARIEKVLYDAGVPVSSSPVKRGRAIIGGKVRSSSMGKKQLHDIRVACVGSRHERSHAGL